MRTKVVVLGVIAIMLLSITYVYAQGYGTGPGMGRGMGPGYKGMHESWGPAKDYPLTPEQRAKSLELRRKFNEENAKLIGAMVTKRLELQSLWTDPKADPKTIVEKEKELRDLQNQLSDKEVQMKLEARKFLTPEQIENWRPGRGMGMGPRDRGYLAGGGFGRGRGGMGPGYGCY
jgi:Spy/CpxP family protein refolding chaperone